MQVGPEVIIKAKAGSNLEGKLTLAEAAGLRAIHAEIRQLEHRRRELALEIQKLGVEHEEVVDSLKQAWLEICPIHGFDPNVPVEAWQITKKNRAMLDPKFHPAKGRIHARPSDKPGDPGEHPGNAPDGGHDGEALPGGGAPDARAEDDAPPPA